MSINKLKKNKFFVLSYRLISPFFDPFKLISAVPGYFFYFIDMYKYSRLKDSEHIGIKDLYPQLHDNTKTTLFDEIN